VIIEEPISFTANEDTYVEFCTPNANHCSENRVLVAADREGSCEARGLLKFTLPSIPTGSEISQAWLRLKVNSTCPSFDCPDGTRVIICRAGAAWAECSVTWPTQPPPPVPLGCCWYDYLPVPDEFGWLWFDVTCVAEEWYEDGKPNYGLRMDAEFGWFDFLSKNSGHSPILTVEYYLPPPLGMK
jgi:hypothetical protein